MSDRIILIILAYGFVVIVATLVAVGAAYLARLDSASYPAALNRAAIAFAASLTLAATLLSVVH
ncbi:hypothetical protein [Streptomyces sp. NPDC001604]|uniref:hypothetical protein n=1 Tax=Streptomyces sp. NPDC001604 TaxID=3364593 RepID=UPI0036C30932